MGSPQPYFNYSKHSRAPVDTKVSALITARGRWDVSEVYSLFTFMEAETILSIRLVCDNMDQRIWHFTKHGWYTIKIGYRTSLEYKNLDVCQVGYGVGSSPSKKLWKHLWKMKVPPKIQHFLWLLAQNGIPTKAVLF